MKKQITRLLLSLLAVFGFSQSASAQCQAYFSYTYQPPGVVIFSDSSFTGGSVNNQYIWDFGDGQTGSGPMATHTYTTSGVYQVCMILQTSTSCVDTFCTNVSINLGGCNLAVNTVPDANFSVVNAVATGGTPPYQYAWNTISPYSFDTLLAAGNYCVTVYDAQGCTATSCYNWGGVSCNPIFTFSQTSSNSFLFVGSYGGNVTGVTWNFGDGNTAVNSPNVQHSYSAPGTYVVTLTAYVNGVVCGTYVGTVVVTTVPSGCQAYYWVTYQPNGVCIFMDSSYVGGSTSNQYDWDFGDGTTGSGLINTHVYTAPGPYNVCLTITTASGCTDTYCSVVYPLFNGCNMAVSVAPDINNVMVNATVNGGTQPYTYSWNTISTFSFDTLLTNGNYCVTVTDAAGCTASSCYAYTGGTNCQTVFTHTQVNSNTFYFISAMSGNITDWVWNFGDGTSDSTNVNPQHTYTGSGIFVVTLTGYINGVICGVSNYSIYVQPQPNTYICGYYFNDLNMNGLLDAGEPGVNNTGIPNTSYIYVYGGPGIQNTIIPDSNGFYSISLPAGTYTLQTCQYTTGWSFTVPADTVSCALYSFTLNPNDSICGFNFGIANTNGAIAGNVFYDNNNNGIMDGGESGIPYQTVHIGNYTVWTNASGYYFLFVPPGTYSISYNIGSNFQGYTLTSPSPQSQVVATAGTTYGGHDFGIYLANGTINLGVGLDPHTTVTPGFPAWYDIDVCNYGNVATAATVTLYYDSYLTLNYSNPAAASNNTTNNFMVWNLPVIAPGTCTSIWVSFQASTSVPLGYPALNLVTVDPTAGVDAYPANNVDTTHQITVGSWDPNNKLVTRTNTNIMEEQYAFGIDSDQELNYTVNFQNTGTAPAVNVIVEDVISSNADINSFELISTSHNCVVSMNGNNVTYQFPGIMLPDSLSNEPQSHGYIKYKVNALNTLNIGEQVSDFASIYFDFNAPVLTNYATVTIVGITGVGEAENTVFQIAPVPAKEQAQLRLESKVNTMVKVEMLSVEGKLIEKVYEGNLGTGQHLLNLNCAHLSNGMYFVKVTRNDVVQVQKIVVQH